MRRVAAVGTKDEGYSKYFDLSCRTVGGYTPEILGIGEKWLGFETGLQLVYKWLQSIDPNDTVLLLDRYDIVITDSLSRVFDHFDTLAGKAPPGKPLFFCSSERGNFVVKAMFGSFKDKHINTGSIIAHAGDMRTMFAELIATRGLVDDQKLITEYFNRHDAAITVEIDNQEFFIVYGHGQLNRGASFRYSKGPAHFPPGIKQLRISGSKVAPVLVHRPANADMVALLRDLGYNVDTDEVKRPNYWLRTGQHWLKLLTAER